MELKKYGDEELKERLNKLQAWETENIVTIHKKRDRR